LRFSIPFGNPVIVYTNTVATVVDTLQDRQQNENNLLSSIISPQDWMEVVPKAIDTVQYSQLEVNRDSEYPEPSIHG
jgi:hypothetical protein